MKLPWLRKASADASNQDPGAEAERIAREFLCARGLTIVATNFRCRRGEIDIIANHDGTLVFAEVRLRSNRHFGDGADSIDNRKQQRLVRAAEYYLAEKWRGELPPCRFDALSLAPAPDKMPPYHVEWIQDAFWSGF